MLSKEDIARYRHELQAANKHSALAVIIDLICNQALAAVEPQITNGKVCANGDGEHTVAWEKPQKDANYRVVIDRA